MNLDPKKTVGELALETPALLPVFEELGIDYCCGGQVPLEQACRKAEVPVEQVAQRLEERAAIAQERERDWMNEPLFGLVAYIVNHHHYFTRRETARLEELLRKVCDAHGEKRPELFRMRDLFRALSGELHMHMAREEQVLFPYITDLEKRVTRHEPVLPPPFGTVLNPIRMMMHEHDSAGETLKALRSLAAGYAVPAEACMSWRALYQGLQEFEQDLHRHIHLENNLLFPRAAKLEEKVETRAATA
ncbi:MAG TPA: iron-sulfur cluster repair di-iron protein [Terriglobales bacterium]|nr:iron-sulfur cluster repair di-iron protein [Terriglobales bacterium]